MCVWRLEWITNSEGVVGIVIQTWFIFIEVRVQLVKVRHYKTRIVFALYKTRVVSRLSYIRNGAGPITAFCILSVLLLASNRSASAGLEVV